MLPPEAGNLTGLQKLDLDGNPLRMPPAEILKQGVPAILAYLRSQQGKGEHLSPAIIQPQSVDDSEIIKQLQNRLKNLDTDKRWQNRLKNWNADKQCKYNEQGRVIQLNLAELGLSEVPLEVWRLSALQVLNLASNQLSALSTEVVKLSALQELHLPTGCATRFISTLTWFESILLVSCFYKTEVFPILCQ